MARLYYSKNGGELYALLDKEDAGYERQLDRENKNWDAITLTAEAAKGVRIDGSQVVREGKVVNR